MYYPTNGAETRGINANNPNQINTIPPQDKETHNNWLSSTCKHQALNPSCMHATSHIELEQEGINAQSPNQINTINQ